MILFTVEIIKQLVGSLARPGSTVLYNVEPSLPYPRAVVCNWNQNGNTTNPYPVGPCSTCEIEMISCVNLNTSANCTDMWIHTPIQTAGGLFDCWVYNGDFNNQLSSNTTAYGGGIETLWLVEKLPPTDPPQNRAGSQISFFNNDGTEIDPAAVYGEVNFCPTDYDSFYALQLVNTIHNELPSSNPNFNTTRYSTAVSTVSLLYTPNDTQSYIGITFSYQTLSEQVIFFDYAYNVNNMFGDFAGMIGTLMGLDVIKVAGSIPMFYLAWKNRNMVAIEDHFNG